MPGNLRNKPLVEAILEVRWGRNPLPQAGPMVSAFTITGSMNVLNTDPHYRILLARMSEKVSTIGYPFHEQLPSAMVPDEMVFQIVQHRFRNQPNGWPLVQMGPGIITLNHSSNYTWSKFRENTLVLVDTLESAHPSPNEFRATSYTLKYINAIQFDYTKGNVVEFLKDKLHINIDFSDHFFQDEGIQAKPSNMILNITFPSAQLKGLLTNQIGTGLSNNVPSIVWEIGFASDDDLPDIFSSNFVDWLDNAHSLIERWFFYAIEGELERVFGYE